MSKDDDTEQQTSAIISAVVKNLPLILGALGVVGGTTGGYMKGSSDTKAEYQQMIEMQQKTLNYMEGIKDACQEKALYADKARNSPEYVRGSLEQTAIDVARAAEEAAGPQ